MRIQSVKNGLVFCKLIYHSLVGGVMGYAFISYSIKNQATADAMRMLLQRNQIDTWMAPYDIPAGYEYAGIIADALSGCSCLILMLSKESQDSPWVNKEVNIAISSRKTVIPVQIEDVELNSSMRLYINDRQIMPIKVIDEESPEIQKLLRSVLAHTGSHAETTRIQCEEMTLSTRMVSAPKSIELVVWSPVNTDVYLNEKDNLVLRIDHNTGYDYQRSNIDVSGSFRLIFVAKGFEKVRSFNTATVSNKIELRLHSILTQKEIKNSYDREEAICQLEEEATSYAFKQLVHVGLPDDCDLLLSELNKLTTTPHNGRHTDYLIACCISALGNLAIKYKRTVDVKVIYDIYETYESKSSYGYIIEPIIKQLNENS